eukprot:5135325-Pyramimonas_sp.AAC.1
MSSLGCIRSVIGLHERAQGRVGQRGSDISWGFPHAPWGFPCAPPGLCRVVARHFVGPKRAPRRAKRAPRGPEDGPRGPRVAERS